MLGFRFRRIFDFLYASVLVIERVNKTKQNANKNNLFLCVGRACFIFIFIYFLLLLLFLSFQDHFEKYFYTNQLFLQAHIAAFKLVLTKEYCCDYSAHQKCWNVWEKLYVKKMMFL